VGLTSRNRIREYAFLGLAGLVGLSGGVALLFLGPRLLAAFSLAQWTLFVLLSLLIKGLGGRAVPREDHSLVGIVDLAAILLFGPVGGACVAAGGSFLHQIERGILAGIRARRESRAISFSFFAGSALFDSGLKVFMALASAALYRLAGGPFPLPVPLDATAIVPAAVLFLGWFLMDHLGWAAAQATLGGWSNVRQWLQTIIVPSLLLELLPLPLSILMVVTYSAPLTFALVTAGLVGTSFVIQRLFTAVQEQRRSTQELATLNEVARAIVQAELNVEGLCELIYEQARRVVDTSIFHLGLFEEDHFTMQIRVIDGVRQDPMTVTLAPGEGIVGWMRQSKQPLLVGDFEREMDRLPARPRYLSEHPPRSAIFVPLMSRGEVIGSLSIQNPRPAAFTEQHLRILSFIANLAATAIEKARLYQAARERAAELERIAQENAALYSQVRQERDRLELLYDVARDLTHRLDLEDLLRRLLQRTVESLQAEDGTLLLLGTRREPPRAIAAHGEPQGDLQAIVEKGLAGWVLQNRLPALLPNVHEDPRWLSTGQQVGSAVAVPILHGDTAWGVITLTHPEPGFFASTDPTLLLALAEQAAVGLEASRLYEAQRRRAVQLQTIAQVMRSILSILEIDPLLDEVVQLVRERFGYTHVHIFTLDPTDEEEAIFRASTDPDSPFWKGRGGRTSLNEGLVGWVVRHGEPVSVGDVQQDPRWLPDQLDVLSEVAVPLKVADEVVGVLDVQSGDKDAFDDEDLFILRTLADQIAVALESARLYAAQQEEAWVLNALLQVAQNIAQARDLDDLLEVVVRLVPLLVGVERCVLFLRDRDEGNFRAIHGYGVQEEALSEMPFTAGEMPAFDRVVQEANPVALVGLEEKGTVPAPLWEALGRATMWLFPLLVGGEVSSVLVLGLGKGINFLTSRQHTILAGITHQAGIAIEEARLRGAAAERQRMEQELSVAREIQRSLLPACCPEAPGWSIEVAWEAARQVGGDFYDFIHLPDNHLGVVIADVSDKGVPAALFMVLSRSLMRGSAASHPSPAETLKRVNRLLLEDARAEMFVTVFYAVIDLATGGMRYASGGHNPPMLCPGDGGPIVSLEAPGIVLGVIKDARIEDRSVQLQPGDTLALYTDGVTEAINAAEEQFGEERLSQIICGHPGQDLGQVRQALLDALEEFRAGQPPFDDTTLVLVRREEARSKMQEA
jgi:serine phosphatase RsbU (regulator of sigma subunit)/putative methionine-R-sulfoxide reductase with GAF domain